MKKVTLLAAVVGSLLLSTPSWAHRAWIKPDATVLSQPNSWVTFDAAVSNDIFSFDHVAMNMSTVSALGPDHQPVPLHNTATAKQRSIFDLHLIQEGTYKVFVASQSLQARWLTPEGERKVWPGRGVVATLADFERDVPKQAQDLTVIASSRRVETFVTAGAPTEAVLQPTGKGLELVAATHPNDLYQGEEMHFQFLIDGEPAVGVEIEVVPAGMRYREQQMEIKLQTSLDGRASITWPVAGQYFLEASYTDNRASAPADTRRGTYSAVFEVL